MRRRAEGPENDISTMTRHPVRTEDRGGTWATRILTLVMGLAVVAVPLPRPRCPWSSMASSKTPREGCA